MGRTGCAAGLVGLAGASATLLLALGIAFAGTPDIRIQVLAGFSLLLACGLVGGLGAVVGALAAPRPGAWCLVIAAAGAAWPALAAVGGAVLAPVSWETRLVYLLAALALSLPSALMVGAAALLRQGAAASPAP